MKRKSGSFEFRYRRGINVFFPLNRVGINRSILKKRKTKMTHFLEFFTHFTKHNTKNKVLIRESNKKGPN